MACPPNVSSASTRLVEGLSLVRHLHPASSVSHSDLEVDELSRTGPMVYSSFYVPLGSHRSLLADRHRFDDSKALTPQTRSNLMRTLCTSSTDLHATCGWAVKVMSARDLSAGMLRPAGAYNLNAQAMDATIELIRGVLAQGINVKEMYVDTVGAPQTYQNKLSRIFPTISITVAKKADSLYPCVSAASVCAKVTRDAALEVLYEALSSQSSTRPPSAGGSAPARPSGEVTATDKTSRSSASLQEGGWGSGYPSDSRCSTWLKQNMNPVFGWGHECRFSWSTAKDMLEGHGSSASSTSRGRGNPSSFTSTGATRRATKNTPTTASTSAGTPKDITTDIRTVRVTWPDPSNLSVEDEERHRVTDYLIGSTTTASEEMANGGGIKRRDEMEGWFGNALSEAVF